MDAENVGATGGGKGLVAWGVAGGEAFVGYAQEDGAVEGSEFGEALDDLYVLRSRFREPQARVEYPAGD